MERLLCNGKTSEMIPFDLKSPLVLYPVRHHSPVCSYHLIKTIEEYKPDIILIEGPENANHLIPSLVHEETQLPAAIYYYYKDKKKLVSDNADDYKCYYPFQYSSPEYNALVQAQKLGIEARFIDLPYCEILIHTTDGAGMRKSADKHSYTDDSMLVQSRFYEKLCEKSEVRNFEEFWEKYFETDGLYISTSEFVSLMNTYCMLVRHSTSEKILEADGTLSRENHMAYNIIEAMKSYNKVLAVTGGFHTSGLYRLIQSGKVKPIKIHKITNDNHGCYPMAYSYRAVDSLRGYSSGMMYPGFYDNAMKYMLSSENPVGVYNSGTLNLLTETAKKSAKKDIPISIADMTAAYSMMHGLAALRNTKECGMNELIDAVTSCFIKGEKTVSSSLPVDILRQLASGNAVGKIGDKQYIPPLITDFEKQCSKLKIKYTSSVPETIDVSLFTSSRGREVSKFLHRMKFLGTGFSKIVKGPDIYNNQDMSRVREEWKYQRNPEVDSSLIDHTTDGFTIEEACTNYAGKILDRYRKCSAAASVAVDCFQIGIKLGSAEQKLLDEIITADGDFFSVGNGMRNFETLFRLQNLYNFQDDSTLRYLIRCFDRLVSALPLMANAPSEKADEIINIMRSMYSIATKILPEKTEYLESALTSIAGAEEKEPAVFGAAMGILYAIDSKNSADAENAARGYLAGTVAIRKKGADYLRGLFTTSRDIVFTDSSFLEMTDQLIISMDYDDFLEILPSMRLAFSSFTPNELRIVAKTASKLHNVNENDIFMKPAVNEKLFLFGENFDRMICESLNMEGLLNE